LNYAANDPYVNFSLTQFDYVNEFATDFNYMQSGPVPTVTYLEAQFVIYDPTDEEGTKRYDSFVIEVISSGQTASAFCDYDQLSVVANTEKSAKNFYTVGSGVSEILFPTKLEGWSSVHSDANQAENCKANVQLSVEVEYLSGSWRTIATYDENEAYMPDIACACEEPTHATYRRNLADDMQMYNGDGTCDCNMDNTDRHMWFTAASDLIQLNVDMSR
jgi:hypothetical protein